MSLSGIYIKHDFNFLLTLRILFKTFKYGSWEDLRIETAGSITGQPKSGGKVSEFVALLGVKPGLGEPEKVASLFDKSTHLLCP